MGITHLTQIIIQYRITNCHKAQHTIVCERSIDSVPNILTTCIIFYIVAHTRGQIHGLTYKQVNNLTHVLSHT
ncbi:hypothetical protein HMPREF3208_01149 [Gardnerella vaginalis]|uniref:Uncharacterized protein n=1 Tax=Gardnerella vaginalis TaxID=2702 RepID=A0A133NS99_GARVA|nr:hypothetical protein HMPREF3208_01149 [Gardnerella vaginalis]